MIFKSSDNYENIFKPEPLPQPSRLESGPLKYHKQIPKSYKKPQKRLLAEDEKENWQGFKNEVGFK